MSLFLGIISTLFLPLLTPSELDIEIVLQNITPLVSTEYNQALMTPFTKEEIYATLQQTCKALDPDGIHEILYQHFRHIIGDDVTSFVSNILQGISSPACIGKTNIALITKVKDPSKVVEFRPIALCNVFYS